MSILHPRAGRTRRMQCTSSMDCVLLSSSFYVSQSSTLSLYSLYTKFEHAQDLSNSDPLQNILIVTRQHILLDRPSNSLESLMRLTLVIIVLHILHRSKSRLDRHIVPLIARIRDRSSNRSSEDVWLAVLREKKTPVNNRSIAFPPDISLSFRMASAT